MYLPPHTHPVHPATHYSSNILCSREQPGGLGRTELTLVERAFHETAQPILLGPLDLGCRGVQGRGPAVGTYAG